MAPKAHALLSPSAAARRLKCPAPVAMCLKCPAPVAMCLDLPDESSPFALEGSVAHAVAESVLTGRPYKAPAGAEKIDPAPFYDLVKPYTDFVVRAACIRKAAADGSKEILLFLQEHGVRSVFDLDSKFYPDLLKLCEIKEG